MLYNSLEGDHMTDIRHRLFALQDEKYRDFQAKLMPTVDKNKIIGVRTPALRALAKELRGSDGAENFLLILPHRYYEEDNLHAFLIEYIKDFDTCVDALDAFLPFVDNWATCDSMNPKCLISQPKKLLEHTEKWLCSTHTYTIRYGIGVLMRHFLDNRFELRFAQRVAAIRSDEYYVNMMRAWYFSTALAKQYDAVLPFIENCVLDAWTHAKAIQKACESYRITPEQKEYLRKLK